jgi:hypothetical protein
VLSESWAAVSFENAAGSPKQGEHAETTIAAAIEINIALYHFKTCGRATRVRHSNGIFGRPPRWPMCLTRKAAAVELKLDRYESMRKVSIL